MPLLILDADHFEERDGCAWCWPAAETLAAAARELTPAPNSHPAPSPLPSDATVPAVHPASPEVTTTPGSASPVDDEETRE